MNSPDQKLLESLLEAATTDAADQLPEFIPADAPFSTTQRAFLNGLFAGISKGSQLGSAPAVDQTPLNILFGSQTGTAEALSKALKKHASGQGFEGKVTDLQEVVPADLAAMDHLVIIAATYGEGEPTDNAQDFFTALMADDAPTLPASLNFSVCGLGDSSYPNFNQIGKELDRRLEDLGATRAAPLVVCDLDYEADFETWRDDLFDAPAFASAAGAAYSAAADDDEPEPLYDKNRPYLGTLINCECLSAERSGKRINHIEIALTGGGKDLEFEVGDALGLWPLNDLEDVRLILERAQLAGTELVSLKGEQVSLRQALFRSLDLRTLSPKTAEAWGIPEESELELIDALDQRAQPPSAQELVDGLRSLQPRLYSISSSPRKHPGEVHLTVGEVHYELHGTARNGVASNYLGSRLTEGGAVGVYVQKAAHFRVPDDNDQPLIMIGPGTGIAPFRAFLEEREARGSKGRNWLFFGDQHEQLDFLYRDQINGWRESGLLTELSLAWSRDGNEKVYVQHLIEARGAEFFAWLEQRAVVAICGDAARMAPDVEAAMLRVIAEHGQMDDAAAEAYLNEMRKSHRYIRDVY